LHTAAEAANGRSGEPVAAVKCQWFWSCRDPSYCNLVETESRRGEWENGQLSQVLAAHFMVKDSHKPTLLCFGGLNWFVWSGRRNA